MTKYGAAFNDGQHFVSQYAAKDEFIAEYIIKILLPHTPEYFNAHISHYHHHYLLDNMNITELPN